RGCLIEISLDSQAVIQTASHRLRVTSVLLTNVINRNAREVDPEPGVDGVDNRFRPAEHRPDDVRTCAVSDAVRSSRFGLDLKGMIILLRKCIPSVPQSSTKGCHKCSPPFQ